MTERRVLVDSDVWSEFYRKRTGEPSAQVRELRQLIVGQRVALLGVVRQEVLCGWRHFHQFEQIRDLLQAFPDQPVTMREHELAAEFFNLCRSKGIQGSNTDFLICACSVLWNVPVLTKDADFERYAQEVPVKLYVVSSWRLRLRPSREEHREALHLHPQLLFAFSLRSG